MTDVSAGTTNPVVVIGAGPAGLAAAANLVERGIDVVVLERGERAAAAVREWSHVRLFSQWSELVDPSARRLLEPTGWAAPDPDGYPTGGEWADRYLQPLADALGARVRYGATVTGVARRGRDRVVDSGREGQPFTVHLDPADGGPTRVTAAAVIDAMRKSPMWEGRTPADGVVPAAVRRHIAGMREMSVDGYLGGSKAMQDWPGALDRLHEIKVPTLVLVGENDNLLNASRTIHERIAGSRFVLLRNSGHGTNMWRPQAFEEATLAFLADVASGREVAGAVTS